MNWKQLIYSEEFNLVLAGLGNLEETVKAKTQQLKRGLLQHLVNRQPNGYNGNSIRCKCGNSVKFIQHRSKDIHTLFGWIWMHLASLSMLTLQLCWLNDEWEQLWLPNPCQFENSTYKCEMHPMGNRV